MSENRNVLLILADQFRHDCLGAAGNPVIQTPNLDSLAAEGVLFNNCFVQSCPCGPSRMSICTGRYMCSTRSVENMTPLAEAEDNVAQYLRDGGHECGFIGYNDYAVDPAICPPGDPRRTSLNYDNFLPGFDVVLDHELDSPQYFEMLRRKGYPPDFCRPGTIHEQDVPPEGLNGHLPLFYPARYKTEDSDLRFLTGAALDYLRAPHDRPVFLSLNYLKPHAPQVCSAPYHALYADAAFPPPARRPEELDDPHPYIRMAQRFPALMDPRELQEVRSCYYGMITELDASLGILFQGLKDAGLWDNTLIIFSADHGEYLGDHYLIDKNHFYDAAMHVPCIVRDPSHEANTTRGTRLDGFCESIDFTPTLIDYAGIPIPDRVQGRSLLGVIRDHPNAVLKTAIHYEYDFRMQSRKNPGADPDEYVLWVLRDHAFKLVQFGPEHMPPLLFDLKADPCEFHNLADKPEYAATLAHYCQEMIRWRMKNEDQRMEHWAYQYR